MEGYLAISVRPGASSFSARQTHLESCCGAVRIRILRVTVLVDIDCEVPLYKVSLGSFTLFFPIVVFGCSQ